MSTTSLIADLWATETVAELFDSSGIGFIIIEPGGGIIDVNRTFCEKTGYSRAELLEKKMIELTHPDDLRMTQNLFQHVREENVVQVFDKRYLTKDGKELWCKLRSEAVRNDKGEIIYRLVMVEDITRAKQQELYKEQMAAIIEASMDAIFRTDTRGIIQFWSPGAERMYGYMAAEALGQHASMLVSWEEDRSRQEAVITQILEGKVVKQPDGFSRHKNGHYLEISALVFPLRNKQGEITAIAAVHRDIGEIKRLQQQLRHAQRMETAGMLAGSIAHDFNNILTVIKGSCDVIEQESPELLHTGSHLDMIERSADKATLLTRQLLMFSRRQEIAPEIFDPNEKLLGLRQMLRRTLGADITVETHLASRGLIREDPTQLEQIILNLAVNARQAMPGGGRLDIATSDVELDAPPQPAQDWLGFAPQPIEPGCYVMITVTDTGTGISEDLLERIFEPFFSSREKEEGTGLGLSVVYGMVTQAGGGIHVSTRAQQGTTFRIYMPKVNESGM